MLLEKHGRDPDAETTWHTRISRASAPPTGHHGCDQETDGRSRTCPTILALIPARTVVNISHLSPRSTVPHSTIPKERSE